jgi:hypothetical protein
MINKFLKAKHWLLFVLTSAIPFVLKIIIIILLASRFANNILRGNQDLSEVFKYMKFIIVAMILSRAILLGWLWSVATGIQKKIPSDIIFKIRKFKIFYFILAGYYLISLALLMLTINNLSTHSPHFNLLPLGVLFILLIPLQLFAIFCMFYTTYFVSKTIKTAELQRIVTFNDFSLEFILILFYPIGIWIIQPMINKMTQ